MSFEKELHLVIVGYTELYHHIPHTVATSCNRRLSYSMFSKLKSKKAPISLNSVSNALKNAGSESLTSADIPKKDLDLYVSSQLGLSRHAVVAMAYDPVQSLLAISTKNGEIRVFGQHSVEVVFEFKRGTTFTELRFVKGVYLVGILATNGVTVLSLHLKTVLQSYLPPGSVVATALDPSLDWLILGLANGLLLVYDVDRLNLTPFRVDNLQKKVLPKQKMSPVLHVEWHPRDIGTILVAYSHCAVVYSLTMGEIKTVFIYQLSKGARGFENSLFVDNGGKKKMFSSKEVIPELVEAHFHPNGLHVVTVHKDNTLVFWDANDGTLLEARSLFEINLHVPGPPIPPAAPAPPITSTRWTCSSDPEVTQLVVCGGDPNLNNVIHILEFGFTLKYSITSHEKQGKFYAQPANGQRILPVTLNASNETLVNIIPLPADSLPYFNGNHNPQYLIVQSDVGSFYIIDFESQGKLDMSALILPPSLAAAHPPVVCATVEVIRRIDWYSIVSSRASSGASGKLRLLLKGGAPASTNLVPRALGFDDEARTVSITGHEGGLVRFLDVSRGEHSHQESIVQVSLRETLYDDGSSKAMRIVAVSCAFESKELLIGMGNGDVVICNYGKININPRASQLGIRDYKDTPVQHQNGSAKILNIRDRILGSFALSTTFLPSFLLQVEGSEEISCIKMSNAGFAAIAYKSGRLVVCDVTRGPAVIFNADTVQQFLSLSRGHCYATCLEFAIMEYGQDGYSSVLLLVGTNAGGNLIYFKILPQSNGGFEVVFADKTIGLNYRAMGDKSDEESSKIDQIIPISAVKGTSAVASLEMFQRLSHGIVIPGLVITTSDRDIRVIRPPKNKLSHKVIEDHCLSCGIIQTKNQGILLATLVKSGFIKLSSLPALGDVADIRLPKGVFESIAKAFESGMASGSVLLRTGLMCIKKDTGEFVNICAYLHLENNKRNAKEHPTDLLFNENAIIPPRPAASALQWAKGQTRYISTEDLAHLIAGPNRKPPKYAESQLAYNISPEANPNQAYGGYANTSKESDRGYVAPVRKGQKGAGYGINSLGWIRSFRDGIDSVEETVNGYASAMSETMSESVEGTKNSVYESALKSRIGL